MDDRPKSWSVSVQERVAARHAALVECAEAARWLVRETERARPDINTARAGEIQ